MKIVGKKENCDKIQKSKASGQRGEHLCLEFIFLLVFWVLLLRSILSFFVAVFPFFLFASDSHLLAGLLLYKTFHFMYLIIQLQYFSSVSFLYYFFASVILVSKCMRACVCCCSLAIPEFLRDVDLKLKHGWWMNVFFLFLCVCVLCSFWVIFSFGFCRLHQKYSFFFSSLKMVALVRRDVQRSFMGYVHYHYDLKQRLWQFSSLFSFFVCRLKKRK